MGSGGSKEIPETEIDEAAAREAAEGDAVAEEKTVMTQAHSFSMDAEVDSEPAGAGSEDVVESQDTGNINGIVPAKKTQRKSLITSPSKEPTPRKGLINIKELTDGGKFVVAKRGQRFKKVKYEERAAAKTPVILAKIGSAKIVDQVRTIFVKRNGDKEQKWITLIMTDRNAVNMDQVCQRVQGKLKLKTRCECICKLDGSIIQKISHIKSGETYIAMEMRRPWKSLNYEKVTPARPIKASPLQQIAHKSQKKLDSTSQFASEVRGRKKKKKKKKGNKGKEKGPRNGMPDYSCNDFDELEAKFVAIAKDPAELEKLWDVMDFNDNQIVSLAEIDKLVVQDYPLLNHKSALMRAYKQTCLKEGGDGDAAWVEPNEFPQLLLNIFYFNKLFQCFEQVDTDDDRRRIDEHEFIRGLGMLGMHVSDTDAKQAFDDMDSNDGGIVLFDEFCVWFTKQVSPEREIVDSTVQFASEVRGKGKGNTLQRRVKILEMKVASYEAAALKQAALTTMLYTEIKQDVRWPPGFRGKQTRLPIGRQDNNSTSSFNVFRRSYATGTWAVFCPELHWKTGEPYPTADMVKWFKGVVDTTRKEHLPEGWGNDKKPSKWIDPVAQREPCKADCHFCPGQEANIKETVFCVPIDATHAAWKMKVVMNSKPLVSLASVTSISAGNAEEKSRRVPVLLEDGAGIQVDAVGRHEVVVETRSHNLTLGLMEPEQVLLVLKVWRDRSLAILQECALHTRFVQIYKNHGPAAGASQPHAHSQLVGLGMIPNEIARLATLARIYAEEHAGACVYCDELRAPGAESRVVFDTAHFVAIAPFVQAHPFHVWVMPKARWAHSGACPTFLSCDDDQLRELAGLLQRTLGQLYRVLGDPDYNLVVRSMPPAEAGFHWFIEIVPRICERDGFQLGTGISKISMLPEATAEALRQK